MFIMTIKKEIIEKISEIIRGFDYLLIDIVVRGSEQKPILEIFVDNETGVSADDCAEISKAVGEYLDDGELISSGYRLDVSSPGVERPLKFLQQYPKHLNRQFELSFTSGDEVKNIKAKLKAVEGERLVFVKGKDEYVLSIGDIKSAKVLISF